jgi:uncharacterized membrane protein
MKRAGVVCILVLAFFGIAVSAYLSQHETNGDPLLCDIQNLSGCNLVVSSPYSHILGVSLADFGFLFYTILFVLAAFELVLFNQLIRHTLQGFALIGISASLYSIYTQVFLVRALCIYCLASAAITLLVLIFASMIEPVWKKRIQSPALPTAAA